jgi:hypothetical protein
MDKRVLPQPALPQTNVGRPFGKPPKVISSSPWIPVGVLGSDIARYFPLFIAFIMGDTFEELLNFFTSDRLMKYELYSGPDSVVRKLTKPRLFYIETYNFTQNETASMR